MPTKNEGEGFEDSDGNIIIKKTDRPNNFQEGNHETKSNPRAE